MNVYLVDETWQLAEVYRIRIETFGKGQNIPLDIEFDEKIFTPYEYLLLAEKQQGIATLRLNSSAREFIKIERVAVLPAYQKKGYGALLIQAAEKEIAHRGEHKIVITSQLHAQPFYEKLGYQVNAAKSKEKGSLIPTVYLEKELK